MSKSDIVIEQQPGKPAPSLMRSCFALRTSKNNEHQAIAARDVTRERLLHSEYWATVAETLLPFDIIYVISESRAFFSSYLVIECGRSYATVVELTWTPLPVLLVAQDSLPSNHRIEWAGPDLQYAVIRNSDGIQLGSGFANRDEAVQFLVTHATMR